MRGSGSRRSGQAKAAASRLAAMHQCLLSPLQGAALSRTGSATRMTTSSRLVQGRKPFDVLIEPWGPTSDGRQRRRPCAAAMTPSPGFM